MFLPFPCVVCGDFCRRPFNVEELFSLLLLFFYFLWYVLFFGFLFSAGSPLVSRVLFFGFSSLGAAASFQVFYSFALRSVCFEIWLNTNFFFGFLWVSRDDETRIGFNFPFFYTRI